MGVVNVESHQHQRSSSQPGVRVQDTAWIEGPAHRLDLVQRQFSWSLTKYGGGGLPIANSTVCISVAMTAGGDAISKMTRLKGYCFYGKMWV